MMVNLHNVLINLHCQHQYYILRKERKKTNPEKRWFGEKRRA